MKRAQKITPQKLKSMLGVHFLLVTDKYAYPDNLKIGRNEKVIVAAPVKCSVMFEEHSIFEQDVPSGFGFHLLTPKKDVTGTAVYDTSRLPRRKGRRGVKTSHSITVGSR